MVWLSSILFGPTKTLSPQIDEKTREKIEKWVLDKIGPAASHVFLSLFFFFCFFLFSDVHLLFIYLFLYFLYIFFLLIICFFFLFYIIIFLSLFLSFYIFYVLVLILYFLKRFYFIYFLRKKFWVFELFVLHKKKMI